MGRYLTIGIATELGFKKKEAEYAFDTVNKAVDYVVENYAPSEIYDMTENEKFLGFKEIISLAERKSWEHFQFDTYWDPICIKGRWSHYLYLNMEGIDLSLDGKIMMECYGSLFRYLTFVLRERYKDFLLAKSLRVTIFG